MDSTKLIFKQALEQAALGDLQFTLRIAEQRMADYEIPEQTVAIMREMAARELALIGVKGTKAMQTESLALVQRYRASIPGYASSFKRVSIPIGSRRDGGRKWVSHRTVLQQRAVPLSLADVRALIHPDPAAVVAAPVKRTVKPKPQTVVPSVPEPVLARPEKRLAPKSGCPVCRRGQMLEKTSDTCFVCNGCGAVLQVTRFERKDIAA